MAKDRLQPEGVFFGPDRWSLVRERVVDPRYAAVWDRVRSETRRVAQAGSLVLPEDTLTVYYFARRRLMDLALTARVTDDPVFRTSLDGAIAWLCDRDLDFWIGPHYPNRPRFQVYHGQKLATGELETATLASGMAIALDWAGDLIDPETRANADRTLDEKAHLLLRNSTLFQSENWVMNHLCVIASALTLVVLRLNRHDRDSDLDLIIRALESWMRTMEDDGSYGEGFHYWSYPVNCLALALLALDRRGIRPGAVECLRPCFRWALYNQVGRWNFEGYANPVATAVNTYDSPFLFQMEAPEVLLYANLFGDPLAAWYIERFLLPPLDRPDCLHAAWHPADGLLLALHDPAVQAAGPQELCLPPTRSFQDTGFTYIRDGWSGLDGPEGDLVCSLLSGGGGRTNSHQHYDKNSLSLFAGGEYWIVDPGHSCYRGEAHQTVDTRTRWHNTLSFDGEDQNLEFVERGMSAEERRAVISHHNRAEILHRRSYPPLDYVVSEARRCYEPALGAFRRHLWYLRGPKLLVVWDQIDPGDHPGVMSWGLNLNNRDGRLTCETAGGRISASRPRSKLLIHVLFPEGVQLERSEGRIHDAYHILPDQPVEGKPGSALRLSLQLGCAPVDLVWIMAPLARGQKEPAIARTGPVSFEVAGAIFALGDPAEVLIDGKARYLF
jgi:hypothetical protein